MVDRRFKITVGGEDKATSIFDRVAKNLGLFNKPITETNKNLKALSDSPAFDGIAHGMEAIGKHADTAVSAIGKLLPSVQSLATLGTLGGAAYFVGSYANRAAAIERTSAAIGENVTDLQLLEGAYRRVGGSTEAMDAQLASLGVALRRARVGENPLGAALANDKGIDLNSRPIAALLRIADIYKGLLKTSTPQTANDFAAAFGLSPELFPLLREGSEGMKNLMEEARRSGIAMSTDASKGAQDFSRALSNAEDSVGGLANEIGAALLPRLQGSVDWLTRFAGIYNRFSASPEWSKAMTDFGGNAFGVKLMQKSGMSLLQQLTLGADLLGVNPFASTPAPKPGAPIATPFTGSSDAANDVLRATGAGRAAFLRESFSPQDAGRVNVDITLRGGPPGTIASVRQSGPVEATARIETSMAGP